METREFVNWTPIGQTLRLGKRIGEGVYEGRFGDETVAVKQMFEGNENEVRILQNLEHENIVKYRHMERTGTAIYIALELCLFNLKQYIEGRHREVSLSRIDVLRQIVNGVNYLHNGQLFCTIHRDLKPPNILFSHSKRDSRWTVKISDFGISKDIKTGKTSTRTQSKGSSGYMAPELLDSEDGKKAVGRVGKETDIFSLGVLFFYTLGDGNHPFSNDPCDVDKAVRDGKPELDNLAEEYKIDSGPLILRMLHKNWTKRPTASEIKAHFMFWDAGRKLYFIQVVSDYLEDRKLHQKLITKLEKDNKKVTDGNWRDKVMGLKENGEVGNPAVKAAFDRREGNTPKKAGQPAESDRKKPAKKTGTQDLLRLIRNWAHHYHDSSTSQELRDELGMLPQGFMHFFESKFCLLLSHTYGVMEEKRTESLFQDFYGLRNVASQSQDAAATNFVPKLEYLDDSDEDLLTLDEKEVGPQNDRTIKLRSYQLELAEQALVGDNSLIVAPTGSGKTAVAYEIIRKHILEGNSKSILFFVSKTTLAIQQYDYFTNHLDADVAYLIGENSAGAPVGSTMKRKKLIVLTPQILIDELNRSKPYFTFDDVSMMIFDECHNAHKKHPYKVIMDRLLDHEMDTKTNLPIQIIGMTASPGVGKAKYREIVLENLITLLANLNVCQCPSVVEINKEELKKYQNDIKEDQIRVPVGSDIFSKKILKAIELIEGRVDSLGVLGSQSGQVPYPPPDKNKQSYEHWAVQLIEHVKLKVYDKEPSKASVARKLVTYGEHLKMYYTLLYLKKHIPNAMDVTNALADFDQNSEEGKFLRRINSELQKASKDAVVPMLERLLMELKKQFRQNSESRCIIFVPRKLIASELKKCIQLDSELAHLRPEYLTGTNEHEAVGGMTKNKQKTSLDAFRAGKCKVLIATSVAEEGLDIRACNLVIMYNYVTNEVGRIQRAGRGRAENSRSILIAPIGSAQIEREKMNEICADATAAAIEDLKELSKDERIRRIRKVQSKQARERRLEREDKVKRMQEAADWQIFCGKCQAFITNADQLRQIKNQHKFVIDPKFMTRVSKRLFTGTRREVAPGVVSVGEFRCQKCSHYLGLEMQYKKKLYPTLTVKQLLFENKDGKRHTGKQWNKCPFDILKSMEDSDDEEEFNRAPKGASKESKQRNKGYEAEDLSDDDVAETMFLLNNS